MKLIVETLSKLSYNGGQKVYLFCLLAENIAIIDAEMDFSTGMLSGFNYKFNF